MHYDPFGTAALRMINYWISECLWDHEKCSKPSKKPLPHRIFDISAPGAITLKCTSDEDQYVVFSGFWGQTSFTRLNVPTLEKFCNGISTSELPQTIRDAVELSRLLGYRYLWVDALCILQDSSGDWSEELRRIPQYILNSALVIVSAAEDYLGGLRHARVPSVLDSPSVPYKWLSSSHRHSDNFSGQGYQGEIAFRAPLADVTANLSRSTWASRGWTMTDRHLAPRMLIFDKDRLFWNCNTHLRSETSRTPQNPLWRLPTCTSFVASVDGSTDRSVWYRLVEYHTFTSRITYPKDRLASMASLASSLAGGDRYFFGIFHNDVYRGLLWRRWVKYASDLDLPSWSWASVEGPITFVVSSNKRRQNPNDAILKGLSATGFDQLEAPIRSTVQDITIHARTCNFLPKSVEIGSQLHFDRDDDQRRWNAFPSPSMAVMLLGQWEKINRRAYRWHGLLIEEATDVVEATVYKRVGVYTGAKQYLYPTSEGNRNIDSDPELDDGLWQWKTLRLI